MFDLIRASPYRVHCLLGTSLAVEGFPQTQHDYVNDIWNQYSFTYHMLVPLIQSLSFKQCYNANAQIVHFKQFMFKLREAEDEIIKYKEMQRFSRPKCTS